MTIKSYVEKCPNHFNGRKNNIPDVIVLHNTGGMKISSAHWWFLDKTSDTSAHFLVDRDGEIRQYVNLADGSYCNGTTSDKTKKHYYGNATNGVVKTRPQNANLYTITIEFVGNVGDPLTETQLETAVTLIKYIRKEIERIYNKTVPLNRLHIIGHYEVAPLTRSDCGKGIQIEDIIERLKERTDVVKKTDPEPEIPKQETAAPKPDSVKHKPEIKAEENPKTTDRLMNGVREKNKRANIIM